MLFESAFDYLVIFHYFLVVAPINEAFKAKKVGIERQRIVNENVKVL